MSNEIFISALTKNSRPNGDCLEWTGSRNSSGYGEIKIDKVRHVAHRLAYQVHVAQIPEGLLVLHLCDNKWCVNPDHLACGTHKANMADMKLKGRAPHGSKHPFAKLSGEDIPRIKALAARGRRHTDIAKQFNVSRPTITKVVNGTAYGREHESSH